MSIPPREWQVPGPGSFLEDIDFPAPVLIDFLPRRAFAGLGREREVKGDEPHPPHPPLPPLPPLREC